MVLRCVLIEREPTEKKRIVSLRIVSFFFLGRFTGRNEGMIILQSKYESDYNLTTTLNSVFST